MLKTRFFEVADERGIRYSWIARQMGYTKEYLSRVKHGVMPITEEFQRRACALFTDVPSEALFFEADGESIHHSVMPITVEAEKEAIPA